MLPVSMFAQFLFFIATIAHMLGLTFAQALQTDVTLVPTEQERNSAKNFEWRLLPKNFVAQESTYTYRVHNTVWPEVAAQSAIVMDAATQQIIWQKNPDDVVPIASITKLMTALVWFDHAPPDGLRHVHTFAPEERTPEGKELRLDVGEKLTTFDLLRTALVGSDNDAALALAHSTEIPEANFVAFMNAKAKVWNMRNTTFVDPTGIGERNVATVRDVALLVRAAFANDNIRIPTTMSEHLQETVETQELVRVRTTNKLLYDTDVDIRGGKTGFTQEAGYCVVVQAHLGRDNRDVIVVVLGAATDDARFAEAKKLIQWAEKYYDWP